METCVTCKHWFSLSGRSGECKKVDCMTGQETNIHGLFTVWCGTDWEGRSKVAKDDLGLVTKPDFGCVCYERKE